MNVHNIQNADGPDYQDARGATQRLGAKSGRFPILLIAIVYAMIELAVLVFIAAVIGATYYGLAFGDTTATKTHFHLGLAMALLIVGASVLQGTYRSERLHAIAEQPDRLALTVLFGFFSLVIVLFLSKTSINFSRFVILVSMVAGYTALLFTRRIASNVLRAFIQRGVIALPRVLLIGSRRQINHFPTHARAFLETHSLVAKVEISEGTSAQERGREIMHARMMVQRLRPDRIVLSIPWSDRATIEALVTPLAELPASIHLDDDPSLRDLLQWANVQTHGPLGVTLVRQPLSRPQIMLKRAFDFTGAAIGLVLLSPLLLLVAIAIKLDSSGPVFFKQTRYGYSRVPFQVLKFRSMTARSSQEAYRQAKRDDVRVTRVGRFLRTTSIDELPQLINVLNGTMSLVGPRPHPVELDEQFAPLIVHYVRRHKIKPGITGWAQVNGHRGETESTAKMEDRLAHDLYYINNWSFWLDFRILAATVVVVVTGQNAF